MECVKETVLKLNSLNEKTDFELIETDQREQICELIINLFLKIRYIEKFEDITMARLVVLI